MSERIELLKLIPKGILRKLLLVLIFAVFIMVDLKLFHRTIFLKYDQLYIAGLAFCISILYYSAEYFLTILSSIYQDEKGWHVKEIDMYVKDVFTFTTSLLWVSVLILVNYYHSLKTIDFLRLILVLPTFRYILRFIKDPKRFLSSIGSLMLLAIK